MDHQSSACGIVGGNVLRVARPHVYNTPQPLTQAGVTYGPPRLPCVCVRGRTTKGFGSAALSRARRPRCMHASA